MRLPAAVIGCSWAGRMHAQAYKLNSSANLVGVSDIVEENAKGLAKELDISCTTDYEELFAKGVDIVSIATPPYAHYEALDRG